MRHYSKITSALKLRSGDAATQGGFDHVRIQSQGLAKRAFVNSPIEMQEYVTARQFVEGIADLDVQRIVRLSSPRTL
nr:unnamed protein product [Callosobruchus chinensis]